jgi:hypothetical protein
MPTMSPVSDTGRYIVQSNDPAQLADFIQSVDADPDMQLLDAIGPANHRHTVVVAMSQEKAASLAQRLGPSTTLKIEPDSPLSLF